ncbi:MAG: hypothetical protein WBL68_19140 [Nitrososphaeraceae archaeon]
MLVTEMTFKDLRKIVATRSSQQQEQTTLFSNEVSNKPSGYGILKAVPRFVSAEGLKAVSTHTLLPLLLLCTL